MPDPRPVHVVCRGDGWIVEREGALLPTSIHYTQASAEAAGRDLARLARTELVTHHRNGQVRTRDSYRDATVIDAVIGAVIDAVMADRP